MKSTFKAVVIAFAVLIGVNAMAATNSWVPSGSAEVSVSSKNLHPTMSFVKYDEPQVFFNGWFNLPAGLALQYSQYSAIEDMNLDGGKDDEMDLAIHKKFMLTPDTYLKFRVKFVDGYPTADLDGNDLLVYDVYLGRVLKLDSANKLTVELRGEYWHYMRDLGEGVISIMPGVTHEVKISEKVSVYDRLGLQWNDELGVFGELLSGQANIGIKSKIAGAWSCSADLGGILPLGSAADTDPRNVGGEIAGTLTVSRSL